MLSEEFKQRIIKQKYIDSNALLKALEEPSPVSIRINPCKWPVSPCNADPVPWCSNGYYLESRPSFTLDPLFHSGCYYPQEASSMFLEEAIKQSAFTLDNIKVLDLCGAPGGKSSHLSSLIGQGSFLIANEVIKARSLILAETLTKWGSDNIMVTQNDPASFGKMQGYFDVIVVDAPCSGEGMFRDKIAVNEWSEDNASHCAVRQKRIIADVWPALKENGLLIYSTCTFNPAENEENILWLTENQSAECVRLDIGKFKEISEIDYKGIYGYGFYPGKVRGDGFFLSVIRKKESHDVIQLRSNSRHKLQPGRIDLKVVQDCTGFSDGRILKWSDELFALPCSIDDYYPVFQSLKVIKPGTLLFVVKNNDYLPTHELALSHKIKPDAFHKVELTYDEALSYLRRDAVLLNDCPLGWIIVTYKGVNLGFVKNIGNRVNNYFPVEWRIRMDKPLDLDKNVIKWKIVGE